MLGSDRYRDSIQLQLSRLQQEVFDGWRRPDTIFPRSSLKQLNGKQGNGPTMKARGRVDLVQDVTSDCSVVASLCAVTARAERGHSNVRPLFVGNVLNLTGARPSPLSSIRMIISQWNRLFLLMANTSFGCTSMDVSVK